MHVKELEKLISIGESAHVEFKESFGEAVIETLVAMANAGGGKVLVGLRDNGTVCGVGGGKPNIASWINDIKMKTSPALFPDIDLASIQHASIAVFSIKDVPVKPVATKGKCFIRRGSSNHLMGIQEIADMYLKTYNLSWDSLIDDDKSPKDLSSKKIEHFRQLLEKQAAVSVHEDSFTLLKKFSLLKEDRKLTYAASLLFCTKPPASAAIHAVRFKGVDKNESVEDYYIQEDLVAETDSLMAFILRSIKKGVRKVSALKQLTHEPVWEYPPDALRELVVNLVIHRDYRGAAPACVFVFDDRIEMWNAGEMPKGLSLDKLQSGDYEPSARNPLLTRVFKEIGLIENLGSGLQKVCRLLKSADLPLPFIEPLASGTRIVICSAARHLETTEKMSEKILAFIKADQFISAAGLARRMGVTSRTIERALAELRTCGKIKRIGPDKGGHWEVIV
ncbi:MAG TPA: hypothetical protein DCZ92_02315 [Elusimicrobia bacterium]|nr:hypothetical protein [Elusimicrobiota bacterium]